MTEIARMYGGSLYDLAAEEGLETRILGELEEVNALFKANPDYLHLLSIPSIPKKERCGLLDEALRGQVHLYVLNFLKILCEKGTLRELGGCTRAYRIRYNEAHGILEATATSAIALTKEQTAALHQKLEALTGKTIDLQTKVDPAVLGGIRLDIDGTELDEAVALFKASPEYLHLLSTPSIPKKERCGLLDEALRDRVHLYVLNFLKILCEKGTLRELPGCARAYRVRYNQAHGILEAAATTAVAMTEQQVKSLHEKLEKLTGKTIDLKTKVDPAVLGGIRLDIEGTELDGTVQNRLAALRRDIASVTL